MVIFGAVLRGGVADSGEHRDRDTGGGRSVQP